MNNKKKLLFIGGGVGIVLVVALSTVILLREYGNGSKGLQTPSSRQTENTQQALSGTPAELRSKGLDFIATRNKVEGLKYLNAARTGFNQLGDKVAVEEIDMQIDQARLIPDTKVEEVAPDVITEDGLNDVTQ